MVRVDFIFFASLTRKLCLSNQSINALQFVFQSKKIPVLLILSLYFWYFMNYLVYSHNTMPLTKTMYVSHVE